MLYPITYLYLAGFIATLIVTILFAVATPPQPSRRTMVISGALVACWSLADFLSNIAQTAIEVEVLAVIFCFIWAPIPFFLLRVVLLYVDYRRVPGSTLYTVVLLCPALFCVYLVHGGLLYQEFLPASVNGAFFQPRATPWQIVVNGYFFCYIAAAVFVLVRAARRPGGEDLRSTTRMLTYFLVPVILLGGIVNGGLAPLGIATPYLASTLGTLFAVGLLVGIIRQQFFMPLATARQERDAARQDLTRREEVLAALPLGVAILDSADTQRLLYSNRIFDELFSATAERGLPPVLTQLLLTSETWPSELLLARPQAAEPLSIEISAGWVRYAGQTAQLITARDTSAQRLIEHELTEKREQLLQAEKMEAIGRLSAGLAHDFNNQLAVILNNAAFVEEELPKDDARREGVEEITRAAERARALTRQLLTFGRKQVARPRVLDVNEVLEGVVRMLKRIIGPEISLEIAPEEHPALVNIDRNQLEQVLMTLATNARDAMPDGGTLSFTVVLPRSDQTGDQRVCLQVQDTGVGMSAEVKARAFEPFYSTKGEHGTGLGLATAFGIVAQAGGELTVRTSPGEGSAFTIALPAAQPTTARATPTASAATATATTATTGEARPEGPITILVVDDEGGVRRAISRTLQRAGYRVLEAASGQEAQPLFERDPTAVDLLLTDLAMPGMNGRDLAVQLQLQRPDLPVLFMSGQLHSHRHLLDDEAPLIEKPFDADRFLVEVRGLLKSSAAPDHRPTILIVDDEEGIRRLLRRFIEPEGYRLLDARTGQEALALAAREPLSVAFVDLGLPDGPGGEVLQALRRAHPELKLIAMSGSLDETEEQHALAKPFSRGQVLSSLRGALS